jgi:hypothetical protein
MRAARFAIHGTVFELQTHRPEVREAVCARWRPFEGRAAMGQEIRIVDLDRRIASTRSSAVRRSAQGAFLQEVAAALYPERILLHAAFIRAGRGSNSALVIGGTGSGKSTIAALARALGLRAPGDDLVALDALGRAQPWPVISGLRLATQRFLREMDLPVETFRVVRRGSMQRTPVRPSAIHLLDSQSENVAAALYAHAFGAWAPKPGVFLSQLLARIDGIPFQRHASLDLDHREGRIEAWSTAQRILKPLGLKPLGEPWRPVPHQPI